MSTTLEQEITGGENPGSLASLYNNGARGLGNRGALDALNAGSIPAVPTNEGIAQSGLEHLAFNQGGAGSNPAAFILLGHMVIGCFIFLYFLGLPVRDTTRWATSAALIGFYTGLYPRRQNA